MSHLYINEESAYSEENACGNEAFRATILHHKKKQNIFVSAADVLHTVLEWDISTGANARSSHWRSSVKKRCS